MKRYTDLLKKAGVNTYIVCKRNITGVELFFVKKNLDMRRMKEVEKVEITVYKDMESENGKTRGGSSILVNPGMTDEEILKKIESARFSVEFSQNPFYELPSKTVSDEVVSESDLMNYEMSEIAAKFTDAFFSEDNDQKAFANSFELFVEEQKVKVITSAGTDVGYKARCVKGEFVAQCKVPIDVETYQNFEYDSLALDDFRELVKRTLKMTADRATASKMPKSGNYDVVISDKYMENMMGFFAERAHSALIFQKYSDYEIGKSVQGDDVKGDILNVKFGVKEAFDVSGVRMVEREFIKNGELKVIHGGLRFCYYLGVEQIGTYEKMILPSGSMPMDEMLSRPCLHIVNFSDFQMDALSGSFGGEIRLAYLYDGKGNVTCVTGGSINGNMFEARKDFRLSSEMQNLANYRGPRAVLCKNVPLAGE